MKSRSSGAIHVLFAALMMSGAVGCDAPAGPADARAKTGAAPLHATFVLDPAASEDYDLSDRCGVPVSSTVVLENGRWRREARWAPGCRESPTPGEAEVFSSAGQFVLRGDTIELRGPATGEFEPEVEQGVLTGDTLTIWGHCAGADVFVRKS
jgi:hypothetical protein